MRDWCAEYFRNHPAPGGLLTITNFDMSPDMKYARILISVLPASKELEVLDYAQRELHEMREYIKTRASMRVFPFFKVGIDDGEKRRQHFDDVLRRAKKADEKN